MDDNTYLQDLVNYLKNEIKENKSEFILNINYSDETTMTGYIHPNGKSGDTFDFQMTKIGENFVLHSNPNITKIKED